MKPNDVSCGGPEITCSAQEDFSDLYEKKSGKRERASEAHLVWDGGG